MTKKALGKGLGAIISTSPTPADDMEKVVIGVSKNNVIDLNLDRIIPNPDQPRTYFDETEIHGLAESIKSVGLIQPIIVREREGLYVIVAGERRYRACKFNEMKSIKAIIIEADDEQNLTMALIENIQRESLNPIEEAKAYKVLINRFKLKQQDLARKVGKERTTITNSLRLLNLPEEIQEGIADKKISSGHAKVILSVEEPDRQLFLFKEVVEKELSVRALENIVNNVKEKNQSSSSQKKSALKTAQIKKMEDELVARLGTKVEIKHSGSKGRIEISYYSLDDFERIIEKIK
ncbi:MAG TPA: ParB/RepB/Spo0J family partition protein [Spirochaetota bacterium]|nr:ParB/RepB/Spo0J family partition protein [Spirochaetota bacterium]